ncbi:hypothetical protein N658DRAFT_489426 [Parathielavia hyrcaniae]|uniref:Uncharacterized protein n=1 Tax=Parathielavia hyrcaniae TaxID=113614 RepID=A0AAN6PSI6_9PEZI|nr:hypothetical protein N658DRAFT_489426 [Parathielavia hyrcaniae]
MFGLTPETLEPKCLGDDRMSEGSEWCPFSDPAPESPAVDQPTILAPTGSSKLVVGTGVLTVDVGFATPSQRLSDEILFVRSTALGCFPVSSHIVGVPGRATSERHKVSVEQPHCKSVLVLETVVRSVRQNAVKMTGTGDSSRTKQSGVANKGPESDRIAAKNC